MRILLLLSMGIMLNLWAEKNEPIRLVIFIHGTIGLRQHLSVNTFLQLLRDKIEKTPYKRSIKLVRKDPFFYQNQAIQAMGFQPIAKTAQKHHHVAPLFAQLYADFDPKKQPKTLYYTFGWSGLASHKERLKAARHFYEGYQELVAQIENEYGTTPITEIVGYSHGATVVLLCEQIRQQEHHDPPFFIDTLILLGTPVHKETERYICSPLFKKIFHFYSRSDNIQCLDCFSTKRFFSRRRFGHRAYCTLPESLHQIEIRITSMSQKPMHQRRVNMSPGHMELWFFGWPNTMYRKTFPIYPLPTASFIPGMIALAEKNPCKHIVLELQPDTGLALVRPRFEHKYKKVPFFNKKKLARLKQKVLQYKPEHFSETLYNAHVHNAIGHAYELKSLKTHRHRKTLCGS